MEQENKELREKVIFLEALLEMNVSGLEKAIQTNRMLIEYLKENSNSVQ